MLIYTNNEGKERESEMGCFTVKKIGPRKKKSENKWGASGGSGVKVIAEEKKQELTRR